MSEAWAKFLRTVDSKRAELGFRKEDKEECFFRGHRNSEWPLLPTLLRHCVKKNATEMRDIESALYFEFRARARELHIQTPDALEVLFHMRHHGLATRLLDWTEVLGVAVYFALRNASETSTPCVWLLNPYALNERSFDDRDLVAPEYLPQGDYDFAEYLVGKGRKKFDWNEPVALYPLQTNARLHAQKGYFTIHGEDRRPIEDIAPQFIRHVDLPKPAWEDAWRFLDDAGINEYLLFPDLDGLTRHLHKKYEI